MANVNCYVETDSQQRFLHIRTTSSLNVPIMEKPIHVDVPLSEQYNGTFYEAIVSTPLHYRVMGMKSCFADSDAQVMPWRVAHSRSWFLSSMDGVRVKSTRAYGS